MAQTIILKNSLKTTTPSGITTGELALTTLNGSEKLWMKNSNNEIKYINVTDEEREVLSRLSVVNNRLQISGDTYSTGELSAYGVGDGTGSTGGGLIATVYDSSDLNGTYLDSNYTDTFNAFTINKLNNDLTSGLSRIATLEGGSATSITTAGTGNTVTSLSKSGTIITANKGITAIIEGDSRLNNARISPYSLTFSGYSTANYNGSTNVTVAIPTKLSQLSNDSAYLTAISKSQVEGVLTGAITTHTHNQYLTGNQTVTLSGDATGAGTTAIAVTLANVGTAGTYTKVTTDAKGRVTAGTNPTTLAGYGIIDALSTGGGTLSGNLTVTGNLVVNGGTTTINSTTMTLDDPVILLGGDTLPTVNDGKDRGVQFNYHNGTTGKTGFFGYDASTGYLTFIKEATNTSEVFGGIMGDIAATNFHGALVGNASTATKLATARTIAVSGDVTGSGSFDGSGNLTIVTTIAAGSVALGTDTTGNYAASVAVSGTGLSLTGAAGEGTAFIVTSNATNVNTASTIVARDGSGNFSAGTITAALSGNSTSATKLQTARTLTVSGTGISSTGGSFDGSGNVAIVMSIDTINGGTW